MIKKLAIITGASEGIGAAIARAFSNAGHPLLLIARNVEKLKALKLPNTLCAAVNITERNAIQKTVDEAIELYGPIGCVVNNAGVLGLGLFGEQSPEEWELMLNTNFLGLLNVTHTVVNAMKEQKSGTMINISSIAADKAVPSASVYSATKAAINAFSETLRLELLESNIRVMLVSPGGVQTDLHTHMKNKTAMEGYKQSIHTIHLLAPEELASMVLYLYQLPQHICVREFVVTPSNQSI